MAAGTTIPAVTGRTRLLGILADPIGHVKTPEVMNDLLRKHGVDAVLVPFHVAPERLEAVVDGLRSVTNFGGFIATVPHKTTMLPLCDRVTDAARAVGAVNCVRREADGTMVGAALDGIGFVEGLRGAGIEPRGLRAQLLGAGGAGASIAFALAEAGVASLAVLNRSAARAEDLVGRLRDAYPSLDLLVGDRAVEAELVVNATSLGMRPDDPLPLDAGRLHDGQVVAEAIMDPAKTLFLAAAARAGARTHPGLPMLASQIELMARHMGALP